MKQGDALTKSGNERKGQEVSEPQMQIPIILRRYNDSTKKDTNQPRIYESTRNQ